MLARITFAVTALALVATMAVLTAGVVSAQDAPIWPVEIDDIVEDLVADEWGVEPDAVVLEWGSHGSSVPAPDASVELVGSGAAGYWIARFENTAGESSQVRLRAGHMSLRPVAARRVTRGTPLSVDDIVTRESFVWGPPVEAGDPVQVGWVVQRALAEGDPLETPAVRPPLLVTSGGPVDLVWQSGQIRVRLSGTAAGSGGLGDEIRVRTTNGKRMNGVIVAPGTVDVTRAVTRITRGGER